MLGSGLKVFGLYAGSLRANILKFSQASKLKGNMGLI